MVQMQGAGGALQTIICYYSCWLLCLFISSISLSVHEGHIFRKQAQIRYQPHNQGECHSACLRGCRLMWKLPKIWLRLC